MRVDRLVFSWKGGGGGSIPYRDKVFWLGGGEEGITAQVTLGNSNAKKASSCDFSDWRGKKPGRENCRKVPYTRRNERGLRVGSPRVCK